ncbi:MAG: hypothetical protein KAT65_30895 [Methanophagales archaeon]|nr:hypothetical protein [Methanophagales archaeon]
MGGVYIFDEESYNRFINLAKKSGLDTQVIENKPQDSGVKINYLGLNGCNKVRHRNVMQNRLKRTAKWQTDSEKEIFSRVVAIVPILIALMSRPYTICSNQKSEMAPFLQY